LASKKILQLIFHHSPRLTESSILEGNFRQCLLVHNKVLFWMDCCRCRPFLLNHCASLILHILLSIITEACCYTFIGPHILGYPSKKLLMILTFSCESITSDKSKYEDTKFFGKVASSSMVLTEVETHMMHIWLLGRRMKGEVALKVLVYLKSCRHNQILSMRLPMREITLLHNSRFWLVVN
jgi:hypothetical protein